MHEDKSGLKRMISAPAVYNLVQFAAGASMYRNRMVRDFIKPAANDRILDIGCGTGEYVKFLDRHCPSYEYYGFDGEAGYVAYSKTLFAGRNNLHFYHRVLTEAGIAEFESFDIVLAIGVMHHMDDALVTSLLRLAKRALKPGGRLVTYDPGRFSDANVIENFFVKHDRGRNIRAPEHYERIVKQVFPVVRLHVPRLTYYPCRNVVFECVND